MSVRSDKDNIMSVRSDKDMSVRCDKDNIMPVRSDKTYVRFRSDKDNFCKSGLIDIIHQLDLIITTYVSQV